MILDYDNLCQKNLLYKFKYIFVRQYSEEYFT